MSVHNIASCVHNIYFLQNLSYFVELREGRLCTRGSARQLSGAIGGGEAPKRWLKFTASCALQPDASEKITVQGILTVPTTDLATVKLVWHTGLCLVAAVAEGWR